MRDYDIRVFNGAGKLSLCMSGNYASDFAAIRAAEHICKEHEKVEVWSGQGCIFASAPRTEGGPGGHLSVA